MSSAERAARRPELPWVDDQLNPLIPPLDLPFSASHTYRGQRYFKGHWCVKVPDNLRDAQQLGREMALAFLRVAPNNCTRQSELQYVTMCILPEQAEALRQGGNAAQVVYAFWGTVARFAEPSATLPAVEHWRGYTQELTQQEKRQDAIYDAAVQREHSQRARHAANARWAKHRKSTDNASRTTNLVRFSKRGRA